MLHSTRHDEYALRYLLAGPLGLLEQRIALTIAALVFHTPDCQGSDCGEDCDAEIMHGTEIALMWSMSDQDDAVVESCLDAHYARWQASAMPQPPAEPSADGRALIARLRDPRNWPDAS